MNKNSTLYLLSFLFIFFIMTGCQVDKTNPGQDKVSAEEVVLALSNEQEKEIIAFVEKLLFAAGNKNVEVMKTMIFDEAIVASTSNKDSVWNTKLWPIDEIYERYLDSDAKPYLEKVDDYEIIISDRMAMVRANATINRFGVPQKREINHMTLIKSDGLWKLFSIAWPAYDLPDNEKAFDLQIFAEGYAQVWGSTRPEFVAMFFEEDGTLQVNDGKPAVGRNEISEVAQSFMTQFPDMHVSFDSLEQQVDGIAFHWTLTGTDADPNGKGHQVRVSGYELWTMSDGNLIQDSKGTFSSEEYNRQLEFGINH